MMEPPIPTIPEMKEPMNPIRNITIIKEMILPNLRFIASKRENMCQWTGTLLGAHYLGGYTVYLDAVFIIHIVFKMTIFAFQKSNLRRKSHSLFWKKMYVSNL